MTDDHKMAETPTLYGHPTSLYTLFFAEMWERFSYYGMRAILVFYMTKGFLGYNDVQATGVYGAYTSLVYMTPFFGGMLADRLLGARRSVLFGGLLMAAGHLVMTFEQTQLFFSALGLIIVGNGFFKPNISTMVGELYPKGSHKRDGGFTLFYMGINLGAMLAPLICGYVGEKIGWHYGFGLATLGMMVGLAVFWAPTWLSQILILGAAVATAAGMLWKMLGTHPVPDTLYILAAIALLASAFTAWRALNRGGLPDHVGRPPSMERLKKYELLTYLGTLLAIPLLGWLIFLDLGKAWLPFMGDAGKPVPLIIILAGLVSLVYLLPKVFAMERNPREKMLAALILIFFSMLFWAFFEQAGSSINQFTDRNVDRVMETRVVEQSDVGKTEEVTLTQEQLGFEIPQVAAVYDALVSRVAARIDAGEVKAKDDKAQELKWDMKPAVLLEASGNNTYVVDGFSWIWADSITRTKDELRNRVSLDFNHDCELSLPKKPEDIEKEGEAKDHSREFWAKSSEDKAKSLLGSRMFTLEKLDSARNRAKDRAKLKNELIPDLEALKVSFPLTSAHLGMGLARSKQEIPASTFQSVNPFLIILLALVFTALWGWLSARNLEPSTPFKFALGLLQLGLGFGALYLGAQGADSRGLVAIGWLILGYLLHTMGELCLSPVGLSMITKLSAAHLVSTMMGMWFLATSFSNYLAAGIAKLTGVGHGGTKSPVMPVPKETVTTYGQVFGGICIAALACAVLAFILVPLLKKWMHDEANPGRGH